MKAMIKIAQLGQPDEVLEIARRFDAGEVVPEADYALRFDSARWLFSCLTGTRFDLLERLRKMGPCSVYALAKSAGRNYSNVHRDVAALEELALVERNEAGHVFTPFDKVEIHLDMAKAA